MKLKEFRQSVINTLILLALLAVLVLPFAQIVVHPQPVYADGESWLTDYLYRQQFTITGSSDGNMTNYQLKFTINRSTGSSANLTAYVGTKCESDYDDIRFTKSDGSTLLDYWIESSNSTTAIIWVEFDSIPTGTTTNFYLYYGYAPATAASNGTATFITFDDFERGSNGDVVGGSWTVSTGSSVISTEHSYGGTRSTKLQGHASTTLIYIAQAAANNSYSIRLRFWKENAVSNFNATMHGNGTKRVKSVINVAEDFLYVRGDGTGIDTGANATPDTWQLIETNNINFTGGTNDYWLNDTKIADDVQIFTNASLNGSIALQNEDTNVGNDVYVDDFIVRKWTPNEPAITSWAGEESDPSLDDLFWIGDSGNWSDTAHWSTSSGGVGGHAVPTSTNNVTFDDASASGAFEVTVNTTANCNNVDFSAIDDDLTFEGTANLTVDGTMILGPSTITTTNWDASNITALSYGTSTINCSGNFTGNDFTYYIVNLTGSTSTVSGNNTFKKLSLASGTTQTINFTDGSTQTVWSSDLSGSSGHVHSLQGTGVAGWNIDYTSIYGVTEPFYPNIAPPAIYSGNKSYVTTQGDGLDPYVMYYDHLTETWSIPVKAGENPLGAEPDTHGVPSILRDAAGYWHIFYGAHGSSTIPAARVLRHAKSDGVDDISSWTEQATIGTRVTYPNPVLASNGDIYLFYRNHDSDTVVPEYYVKSTDNGATWSAPSKIVDIATTGRIYAGNFELETGATEKIHFTWTLADPADTKRNNVYHAYMVITGANAGKLFGMNGTDLGTSISAVEGNANCLVYNSGTSNTHPPRVHVYSAIPYIIFPLDTNGSLPGTYRFTKWSGSSWTTPTAIGPATNQVFYGGAINDFIINSATDIEAYLSVYNASYTIGADIEKWQYNGTAWSKVATVKDSATHDGYMAPWIVQNYDDSLKVVFGEYNGGDFTTHVKIFAYGDDGLVSNTLDVHSFVNVSYSNASPDDTWYADTTSSDNGNNTGWIFYTDDYPLVYPPGEPWSKVLWYQPNNMISDTVLPDRATSDGTQNGVITWGSNPAGVSATYSETGSSTAPHEDSPYTALSYLASFNGTLTTRNIMDYVNVTQPANFYSEDFSPSIFGANFINEMLDAGNWPRSLFWFPWFFFISVALGFIVFKFSKSLLIQCVASELVLAIGCASGVLPLWILVIFPIEALAILVASKAGNFG